METKKILLIVGGLAVVGGGFYLYNKSKKPKTDETKGTDTDATISEEVKEEIKQDVVADTKKIEQSSKTDDELRNIYRNRPFKGTIDDELRRRRTVEMDTSKVDKFSVWLKNFKDIEDARRIESGFIQPRTDSKGIVVGTATTNGVATAMMNMPPIGLTTGTINGVNIPSTANRPIVNAVKGKIDSAFLLKTKCGSAVRPLNKKKRQAWDLCRQTVLNSQTSSFMGNNEWDIFSNFDSKFDL